MTTVEDVIRLLQDLLQVLTRIADDADRRDVIYAPEDVTIVRDLTTNRVIGYRVEQAKLGDDQPHYTYVKTLTVPPGHVTPIHGDSGEIIGYKVRVKA